MNLPVDQANSGAKYEFCCIFMVKVRFLKSNFQTNVLSSHLFQPQSMNIPSQQFISTKSRQTKLSNAYSKQPVQQLDCLLPWQQNPTITKFCDIFENIVLLFLPIFKPFNLDELCLVSLMSYVSALK